MLKIRSTQKLASSHTKGLCDIERIITDYRELYDEVTGIKKGIFVTIQSKHFQEQTIQVLDENENTVDVVERKYITSNQHIETWTFIPEEIEGFKTLLASELEGKNEEEQKLIVFIEQTKTAGSEGKGWNGMDNWIPDTDEHIIVEEFSN